MWVATDAKRKSSQSFSELIPSAISVNAASAEKKYQGLRFFQKSHIQISRADFAAVAIRMIALAAVRITFHVRDIFTSSPASFAKGADGESAPFVRLWSLEGLRYPFQESKHKNPYRSNYVLGDIGSEVGIRHDGKMVSRMVNFVTPCQHHTFYFSIHLF
jgi:hypothetical protein